MHNNKNEIYQLFATCPRGLELLLVDELRQLGAQNVREKLAGVTFQGDLAIAYKALLWSRLANRILLPLASFEAPSEDELYKGVQSISWDQHMDPRGTLAVHFVSSNSEISHTLYGAQKVKDAIVDQARKKHGVRPDVEKYQPDVMIYTYLNRNMATVYLDLSGESLHMRGYRVAKGSAPLKENLAAAILFRAKWPEVFKEGGSLFDPMCGSATLLIEAALMAGNVAPGLLRDYFGIFGWKKHDYALWQKLLDDAHVKRDEGLKHIPLIEGYDEDPQAIRNAFVNIATADLSGMVHVEKKPIDEFAPKAKATTGLVIVNPPYGERLGELDALKPIYKTLGDKLKHHFENWRVGVFSGNADLCKKIGIRSHKNYPLFNGPIACRLFLFEVKPKGFVDTSPEGENERLIKRAKRYVEKDEQSYAQDFINRLRKNLKKKNTGRVYNADLPDFAFSIEIDDEKADVCEYQAPRSVPEEKVMRRRMYVLAMLPELLEKNPRDIFFRIVDAG